MTNRIFFYIKIFITFALLKFGNTQITTNFVYPAPYSPTLVAGKFTSGSSLTVYKAGFADHYVQLSCSVNIPGAAGCSSGSFKLSRDGFTDLSGADEICFQPSTPFTRTSIDDSLVFSYTANINGAFNCEIKAVRIGFSNCDCGWDVNKKIVGGTDASPNEFISMAGIKLDVEPTPFCGGTVINRKFVLTAAHCFTGAQYKAFWNLQILLGYHDLDGSTIYQKMYKANQLIIHEKFNSTNFNDDIALVGVSPSITYNRGIGPACLPFIFYTSPTFIETQTLTVAGWGTTDFGGAVSKILKKVDLTTISNTECEASLPDIRPSKFCTFVPDKDSCQRDSGGGYYVIYEGRKYTFGIVSYGGYCGTAPSAATRVEYYLWWIVRNAGYKFCIPSF